MRTIGSFFATWLGVVAIQLSDSSIPRWGTLLLVSAGLFSVRLAAKSDFKNGYKI